MERRYVAYTSRSANSIHSAIHCLYALLKTETHTGGHAQPLAVFDGPRDFLLLEQLLLHKRQREFVLFVGFLAENFPSVQSRQRFLLRLKLARFEAILRSLIDPGPPAASHVSTHHRNECVRRSLWLKQMSRRELSMIRNRIRPTDFELNSQAKPPVIRSQQHIRLRRISHELLKPPIQNPRLNRTRPPARHAFGQQTGVEDTEQVGPLSDSQSICHDLLSVGAHSCFESVPTHSCILDEDTANHSRVNILSTPQLIEVCQNLLRFISGLSDG